MKSNSKLGFKSELYSKYAQQYDIAVQDNIYNALLERPSLQALIGSTAGLDVIDLGCGSGIYAKRFVAESAKSVTCLDISAEMIGLVKAKLGNRVKAYAQNLSLGLPEELSDSADVIVCPLVLHYIEDLNVVFQEIYRVLKPQGHMVFSTHHPFADFRFSESGNYYERELLNQQWNTIGEPVAVTFYRRSLGEITNAITSAGLVITQLSEGEVAEEVKELSPKIYEKLTTKPSFIFIKCLKI